MEVWNNLNPEVVRNLYSSYENRLVKVIKNHGFDGILIYYLFQQFQILLCSEFFWNVGVRSFLIPYCSLKFRTK